MKKGLLSLLAVVLTVVGCQNYDDQFAALTKDIAAINTTLAGLATVSADVSALKTTVSGLQTSSTALQTALAAAATDIDAIEEAVKGVASSTDLAAVSTALTAVQADVKEILAANSVINQDVTINSVATLEYAESLISTKTDAPTVIVNGNVVVTTGAAVFTADQLTRVNAVTAKMATVLKDLTVSNTATPAATTIDFGALTFVDQSVSFTGATSTPKLKTITSSLTVDVEGAVDYSGLTNIGGGVALDGTGVTSLNLSGVTIGGAISTTGSATNGTLFLPSATSVNAGTAEVTVLSATVATDIDLGKAAALASLSITAPLAATVDVLATSITGALETSLATPTVVFMNSLTYVGGAASIDAVAQFHGKAIDQFGAASTIAADVVDFTALSKNASGTLIISGAHTAGLSLKNFVASTVASVTAAKIIEVKSTTHALLDAPAVETLTINELGATTDFTIGAAATNGSMAAMKTLNITGAAATTVNDTNQNNGVSLGAGAAALVTVNTAGSLQGLTIATMTANFTTVTTAGLMRDLSITGATKLANLTVGHEHIEGMTAASLIIDNNDELTALTTSKLTEVRDIQITGNAKLAAVNLSSMSTLPSGSASGAVTVTANALTGGYVAAVAATETTPYVETIIKSNDLMTIKPLLDLAAASSTNTYTYNLSIDVVTTGSTTSTLAAAFVADTAATSGLTTDTIDIAAELALLAAE
ncbi:MAG: beta strand repeat-containing protein [Flavobacteriaceae bacterium]